MQVHAQVQTLQSLVDDEVRQHGEHWARMRIEMALESAKKKSCGTVVGAAAEAGAGCEVAVGAAARAAGRSAEEGQASEAGGRESEGEGR